MRTTINSIYNQHKQLIRHSRYSGFQHKSLLLILFAFILVTGCKKVTEEPGIVGVCPVVSSTDPANGAVNVSTSKVITAIFSKEMNASTINATTFILKQGTNMVPGIVTYSGTTATFTPSAPLAANTVYTGTITKGAKDPDKNALIEDYVWSFNTGSVPTVISTDPANGSANVALNKIISVTFSTAMNAATINAATFVIKQGATIVPGVITYSGMTATFTPATQLTKGTVYSGLITTGVKDPAGNALFTNYTWNFATGNDPTVISTDPANNAVNVPLNKIITANFSTLMNGLTITSTAFLVKKGSTPVAGTVSYSGSAAVFTPSAPLLPSTTYTGTVTTGAKDALGNALLSDYVWTFTTSGSVVPASMLGTASVFGAFGGNAGITNQGLFTVINNGGIATTAASTLVTGFHDGLTAEVYTETPLNVGNVTGGIYTAPPPPGNATKFGIATNALIDANAAYISISPASKPGGTDPGAGELGGLTLAPGIYKSASGTFKITLGNLTLDAQGDPNAVWIFQTAAGLTVGVAGPTGARSVLLTNGAQAKNVYWYIGSAATINAAGGGVMTGNILATSGITFSTAGNATQTVLNGRAISLVASVTMVNTTINVPN